MIIGKLLHTICPRCIYAELLVAEHKGKKIAYCPNGGDEKINTHTQFIVGKELEPRIKYIEKPKKRVKPSQKPKEIVRKTELDLDYEEEGGIADDEITRT